jgi:hypothetical protein
MTAVFALVLSSPLQESFGFRFGGKKEPRAQFFFPKRKHEFPVCYGGRTGERARAPKSFGGRGFKWREPRQGLGRRPFKPQTALLRWSRAVGPSRCPATAGSLHASVRLVTERVFAKAGRCETSRLVWNATFRPDASEQQQG